MDTSLEASILRSLLEHGPAGEEALQRFITKRLNDQPARLLEHYGEVADSFDSLILRSCVRRGGEGGRMLGEGCKALSEHRRDRLEVLIARSIVPKQEQDRLALRMFLLEGGMEALERIIRALASLDARTRAETLSGFYIAVLRNDAAPRAEIRVLEALDEFAADAREVALSSLRAGEGISGGLLRFLAREPPPEPALAAALVTALEESRDPPPGPWEGWIGAALRAMGNLGAEALLKAWSASAEPRRAKRLLESLWWLFKRLPEATPELAAACVDLQLYEACCQMGAVGARALEHEIERRRDLRFLDGLALPPDAGLAGSIVKHSVRADRVRIWRLLAPMGEIATPSLQKILADSFSGAEANELQPLQGFLVDGLDPKIRALILIKLGRYAEIKRLGKAGVDAVVTHARAVLQHEVLSDSKAAAQALVETGAVSEMSASERSRVMVYAARWDAAEAQTPEAVAALAELLGNQGPVGAFALKGLRELRARRPDLALDALIDAHGDLERLITCADDRVAEALRRVLKDRGRWYVMRPSILDESPPEWHGGNYGDGNDYQVFQEEAAEWPSRRAEAEAMYDQKIREVAELRTRIEERIEAASGRRMGPR